MKFKNRQTPSMVIEIRIVAISGMGQGKVANDSNEHEDK